MGAVVMDPEEIVTNGGIELRQREPRGGGGLSLAEISRERGETFRIQRPKEPLNFPPALRPSDRRIDQLKTQVSRDLLEMGTGEITAMINVEYVRDTADGPRGILLAPNRLA
jgi:hypothetical protein